MKTTIKTCMIILSIGIGLFLFIWGFSFHPKNIYMTNDQIISEVKKCTDAGMRGAEETNNFGTDFGVLQVICFQK